MFRLNRSGLKRALPADGVEIHPWMPRHLHDNNDGGTAQGKETCRMSPLGHECFALGVSIHDREKVYDLQVGLATSRNATMTDP